MKKVIFSLLFMFSASGYAAQCEQSSYQMIKHDYTGNCVDVIVEVMQKKNCSRSLVNIIKQSHPSRQMSTSQSGSSTYCLVETIHGVYQVMMSDMSSPPTAMMMFSRFD